jgi:hypothetical protein
VLNLTRATWYQHSVSGDGTRVSARRARHSRRQDRAVAVARCEG